MESSLARSLRSLMAATALLLAAYSIAASPVTPATTDPLLSLASLREPLGRVQDRLGLHAVRQVGTVVRSAPLRPTTPAPVRSTLVWVTAGVCFAAGLVWRRWPTA